ncbi:prephenate dehydratase [Desulforudis sp. 1088]|uniref:prephenate dehydratase n=1 Tax=unclassified Candidatus Desulforudis TaxID=2635950 RepID=UPI003491646B
MKIGYLGPRGTFSAEAAAMRQNGGAALIPCHSLREIVDGVKEGVLDEGILPAENAAEGSLDETMDILVREHEHIKIGGELILPVQHRLLARPGTAADDVRVVLSHPQALAQCREFVASRLKSARLCPAASTAEAARLVAATDEPWACLGTVEAAALYGLAVLDDNACDIRDNETRFLVITRDALPPSGNDKTSLLVEITDRPGALYALLGNFARRGLNLTRIESRPARTRLGKYLFFIDVEGHAGAPPLDDVLNELRQDCRSLAILGSYPAARPNAGAGAGTGESVEDIRREIDAVDSQILDLLARRAGLVRRIGSLKKGPLRDPVRERAIITRLKELAGRRGYNPETVERIYRLLLADSVAVQEAQRRLQEL